MLVSKRCLMMFFAVGLGLTVAVSSAEAGFIVNGDFESVSGGEFTSWDYRTGGDALDETDSVISGSHTAELVKGVDSIEQGFSSALLSDYQVDLDFACFPVVGGTRSFHFAAFASSGEEGETDDAFITLRANASNQLEVLNNSVQWQSVGALTINTTTDTGTADVWDGEDPVVNHLTIAGHVDENGMLYDVTLNGTTVSGMTAYYGSAPDATSVLNNVRLFASASSANWLADNVSVVTTVPEPNTITLLVFGAMGLLAYAWRKRR